MTTPDKTGLRKACCEHSLIWHHETRGCGYHGHAPEHRCPCLLPFDEALAAHDAEVRRTGHREGYETARNDLVSGAFISGPTYEALRDSFSSRQIAAEVRRDTAERVAQAIEGSIEAHRAAGNRQAVAALAPLPALVREEASRG